MDGLLGIDVNHMHDLVEPSDVYQDKLMKPQSISLPGIQIPCRGPKI
jgi:hypothetical protein